MPGPVRVAVDATSLYGTRSGVGRFVEEILHEGGRRADLDLVAYAITWRGGQRLEEILPAGVAAAAGRRLPARPLRRAWQHLDHPSIDRWLGPADVVHGTNFLVPPTTARSVLTVHDLTYLHHPEMCTDDVLQYRQLVPRALRRGAMVHTVSEFVRREVMEHYALAPERVVAVPNGISRTDLRADAAAGRQLAGGSRYLLWVGTVEPRKDLPTLVAAFDLVADQDPDVRLVLAGQDGWGAEELTGVLAEARHGQRIIRLGRIGEQARVDLLGGALSLVMASRYEGFGLPAGEAMVAGTPVIATAVGGLTELVGDAGVLVEPADVEALAQAIVDLIDDEPRRRLLARSGQQRAEAFTWARTVDGLAGLWRRMAGR